MPCPDLIHIPHNISAVCSACCRYPSYSNKLTALMQLRKFIYWYFCSFLWKTWIISFLFYFFLNRLPWRELLLSLFSFYVSFALQVWFQFSYLVFYFLRGCFCNLKPLQELTTLILLNEIFLPSSSVSFSFLQLSHIFLLLTSVIFPKTSISPNPLTLLLSEDYISCICLS